METSKVGRHHCTPLRPHQNLRSGGSYTPHSALLKLWFSPILSSTTHESVSPLKRQDPTTEVPQISALFPPVRPSPSIQATIFAMYSQTVPKS